MTASNRVALYARVSTDVQAETNYSLDTQLDALRLYAATNAQQVIAEFKDDFTGRSLSRPDLNRLMKLASTKAIDTVVIFSVDRASRNAFNILKLTDDLKAYGVGVHFLDFDYEDSPLGRLLLYIKGFTAESEADQFKERSKRGKRGRVAKGQPLPGIAVPYGYTYQKQVQPDGKRGGEWVVNPTEAALVRRIFKMYAEDGLGTVAITNRLNAEGIKPRDNSFQFTARRSYRGVWSPSSVLSIVSNEAYTGTAYYGKTRREVRRNPDTGKEYTARIDQPRDQWQPFAVPALITAEVFQQAQQRRRTNNKVSQRRTPVDYWLRGRVRCTCCGYRMHAFTRWRDKVRTYQCPGQTRHHSPDGLAPTCHFVVFGDDLESRVWTALVAKFSDPAQVLKDYQGQLTALNETASKIRLELEQTNARIAEGNEQLQRLLDAVVTGLFPPEMVADKTKAIQTLLAEYSHERARLEGQLGQYAGNTDGQELVDYLLRGSGEAAKAQTPDEKRRLVERYGVQVQLNRDNDTKTYMLDISFEIAPETVLEPLLPDTDTLAEDQRREQEFQRNPSPDPDVSTTGSLPSAHEHALPVKPTGTWHFRFTVN